jgi:hypothetical protein
MARPGSWKTQLRAGRRAWELCVRHAFVWPLALAAIPGVFGADRALFAATQVDRENATHSLDCFCFTLLLGYASAGLFSISARGTLEYIVLVAVDLTGLVLAAFWFGWLTTPPCRTAMGDAVKTPAAHAPATTVRWPASNLGNNA